MILKFEVLLCLICVIELNSLIGWLSLPLVVGSLCCYNIIGLVGLLFAIVAGSLSTGSMKMSYVGVFDDWLREEVVR